MDPNAYSRQSSSGPQRRPRTGRASLTLPISRSGSAAASATGSPSNTTRGLRPSHSTHDFAATAGSARGTPSDYGGASSHAGRRSNYPPDSFAQVPNYSPFAARAQYRAGSVAASSRAGTPPIRRSGSLAPGYAPSPLGGVAGPAGLNRTPLSRAGSVAAESVGTVFTAGGTPLRRGRASLNLSSSAVRRTPSMLSIAGGGVYGARTSLGSGGPGLGVSPGEDMLGDFMQSAEGQEDLDRMSVAAGSRSGTPSAPTAAYRSAASLAFHPGADAAAGSARRTTTPAASLRAISRNRSVAPSPSPLRTTAGGSFRPGFGRLQSVTPSRGASPSVGHKRGAESVQGDGWDRMSSLSIEPSRKKQIVFNEQEGRYMTVEQMRALQPKRVMPRSTADRILNEIEGVRTPLGDAQVMARRALLRGDTLPSHVAVPELRADLSSAKAIASRMLPPSLPHSALTKGKGGAATGKPIKPIGPHARRLALNEQLAKRRAAANGESSSEGQQTLLDDVAAIRARDGTDRQQSSALEETEEEEDEAFVDASMEMAVEVDASASAPKAVPSDGVSGDADNVEMAIDEDNAKGKAKDTEEVGSRRTLRPRKPKASATEATAAQDQDTAMSQDNASASNPDAAAKVATQPDQATDASASIPTASAGPAKPLNKPKVKADLFQVVQDSSVRTGSATSSLRQRTEKKFRQHTKSSSAGGRFGLDDDDDDDGGEDEEATAEELEKIQMPKILFPAGFKFGGDSKASSSTATPASTSSAPTSLFGSASPIPKIAAPSKTATVDLPALPPPTDAKPVTSFFDRLGEKAAPVSDLTSSPKKTVTFAEPISSTTTFQTNATASTLSNESSAPAAATVSAAPTSSAASAPAASFAFKAPAPNTPLIGAPKATSTAASDFFSKPAASADGSSNPSTSPAAPAESPAAGIPSFFTSSLKKAEGVTAPQTAPASSSDGKIPNFFASSLSKSADKPAASVPPTSTPNLFGSSAKSTSEAPSAAPVPSSSNTLKAFAGFGAPVSTSPSGGTAASEAPKPLFGGFGSSKPVAPASLPSTSGDTSTTAPTSNSSAPPVPKFTFGGTTSSAPTATPTAPGSAAPLSFGGFGKPTAATSAASTPATPTPLFGGTTTGATSAKRGADDDAQSNDAEGPRTKKTVGAFSFSSGAGTGATSASANAFGNPAATTASSAPATAPFSFGKPAASTAPAAGANPTPAFGGFGGTAQAANGAAGSTTGDTMDTSNSPPKPTFGGFNFGASSTAATPTTGASPFGGGPTPSGTPQGNTTPTSTVFGQTQPAPASTGAFVFGKATGGSSSGNAFGSAMNGTNSGSTTATPFAFGSNTGGQPSAGQANGFGTLNSGTSSAPSMSLNAKPNFNFGSGGAGQAPAGAGGVFTFGANSGTNTPTQSTTPTVAPAMPPAFGFGSAATPATNSGTGSPAPFAFGASSGGTPGAFQFGSGNAGAASPAPSATGFGAPAPFAFGGSTPTQAPGPTTPTNGGPVFNLGAAPPSVGTPGSGPGRTIRALPRRKK